MKAYTDLEQSKTLSNILPIESADMTLPFRHTLKDEYIPGHVISRNYIDVYNEMLALLGRDKEEVCKLIQPVWSLAALLDVLPNNKHIETAISRGSWKIDTLEYLPNTWWCIYEDNKNQTEFNTSADNTVDACVAMIEKLHELKML